jgi:hypothetical protein
MTDQLPYGVEIIRAVGPTIVAIIAAAIALVIGWRQWRTSHDKLKFDLFERRYVVYEATQKLIWGTLAKGRLDEDSLHYSMSEAKEWNFSSRKTC